MMAGTPSNVSLDRLPGGGKNILVKIPSGGESSAAERIIGDVAFEGVKKREGTLGVVQCGEIEHQRKFGLQVFFVALEDKFNGKGGIGFYGGNDFIQVVDTRCAPEAEDDRDTFGG